MIDIYDQVARRGANLPVAFPKMCKSDEILYRVDVYKTKTEHIESLRSYAPDLAYHWSMFGSLFGTITFKPVACEEHLLPPATFTDIELLVDFATSNFFTTEEYMYFRTHQAEVWTNKSAAICDAVKRAISLIIDSSKNIYLKGGAKKITLLRKSQEEGEALNVIEVDVPCRVMTILRSLIEQNIKVYEREVSAHHSSPFLNYDSRNTSSKHFDSNHLLDRVSHQSPIGRMLNFDERSAAEFARLYKELEREGVTTGLRMDLVEKVCGMDCVQRIYIHLLTAATVLDNARQCRRTTGGTLQVKSISTNVTRALKTCVVVNADSGIVQYNSSFEAYPGMLISKVISKDIETEDSRSEYFKTKPFRKAFFNLYSAYVHFIPSIKTAKLEKSVPSLGGVLTGKNYDSLRADSQQSSPLYQAVRWMEPSVMSQLRAMNKKIRMWCGPL